MFRTGSSLCRASSVLLLAFLVVGCESDSTLIDRLSVAEGLPLWQRVVAIALATLISEDMACIAAGLLSSEGALPFFWAFAGGFLGIFLGDLLLYGIGRVGGLALLRRVPFRWFLKEEQIIQAENLFEEHGAKLIFTSRLLPGSRLPIYAAAGILNYSVWKFSLFMSIAGALSAIILVGLSHHLGEVIFDWLEVYESYAVPVFIGVVLLVYLVVKLFEILATRRSRLLFLARCRKLYYRVTGKSKRPS
jgi:membrane protein DedA with SNARE-associated domain